MKRLGTALIAVGLLQVVASSAMATDAREMRAREDFAAGRYQEALDLFAKLYAESLHPNYLRNIGRCYQNLGDPDKAISSFREYLRKAKGLSKDEKKEIDGYIAEMEALKKEREKTAAAANAPPPPPAVVTPPPSATPPPPPPAAVAPPPASNAPVLVSSPPPAAEESSPIYTRWWFWAIAAGVVAAGFGVAAAAGAFTKTEEPSCGGMKTCL